MSTQAFFNIVYSLFNSPAMHESPDEPRSRSSSRRNSSRRSSLKKEPSLEERALSAASTPKKAQKVTGTLDFVVTGKQITKRSVTQNKYQDVSYCFLWRGTHHA